MNMTTQTSESIINNFKQIDNFFGDSIKMIVAISRKPHQLNECEDAVYKDETKKVVRELENTIKEFRTKYPKTLKDRLQILKYRLN